MEKWRLLLTGAKDAAANMAIDNAVLKARMNDLVPNTIRLYKWMPSAISIGYFQGIKEEVDLNACKKNDVDVIRRVTGGGAVFHDADGEVTYSMVVNEKHPMFLEKVESYFLNEIGVHDEMKERWSNLLNSYAILCGGVIEALALLGLKASFRPINDIIVNEKKISGSAQTRHGGYILQHGTVLCDVNPKLMFQLLKVTDEKIKDKMIKNVEERVTSIKRETGEVKQEEVIKTLKTGFETALNIRLVEGKLTDGEVKTSEKLKREKYEGREWNFRR